MHDFTYSFNDPMTRNYFNHPAFDNYPVVGVNWHQARAFCLWRTRLLYDFNMLNSKTEPEFFRLPSEVEWEYAARGGRDFAPYPWGGPYLRNAKGCILANFKPMRGNYPEDGGLYTVKADAYFPNDFGLYNMSGNVAEWCEDAFFENAFQFMHDLNSSVRYNSTGPDDANQDPDAMKRKTLATTYSAVRVNGNSKTLLNVISVSVRFNLSWVVLWLIIKNKNQITLL
jgi:gliding motility-associated lipoprotein GldK